MTETTTRDQELALIVLQAGRPQQVLAKFLNEEKTTLAITGFEVSL